MSGTVSPVPPRYRLESYRFRLPEDRIAQVPPERRTDSRLMVLGRRDGVRTHATFADLPAWLKPGDCLVVNDTRVLPARLFARKPSGGLVELLVLSRSGVSFSAMFGASRGLKPGAELGLLDRDGAPANATAIVTAVAGDGTAELRLDGVDADSALAAWGHMPLPPYIHRTGSQHHALDLVRYQTVYAADAGAVAAPTAGLHFSSALLSQISDMGVFVVRVTLHVGPGTFRPVKCDDVREHDVGTEAYRITGEAAESIERARVEGRRVVAVGTTAVRTLETAAQAGRIVACHGDTRMLITPGYRFRVVSGLVTNFHLPGSSLLLLVSAFAGRTRVLAAYREAVRLGYRFFSYGDAMFIA